METVKVSTSQHVDIDYPVAGLGERIAARLIDLAMFFALYLLFILFMVIVQAVTSSIAIYVLLIVYAASYVFYNLVCEIFMTGQSVGKRLMKIKVISIDGSQPSLGQYFIRWIFRLVDFVITFQIGGIVCIAVSENKQRLGDLVAGTTVIKTVPRTTFDNIAFHPVVEEGYQPFFQHVDQLTDRDVELINEVLTAFYRTSNFELLHAMSVKVAGIISFNAPRYEDELHFLTTVIKDYNHVTSMAE